MGIRDRRLTHREARLSHDSKMDFRAIMARSVFGGHNSHFVGLLSACLREQACQGHDVMGCGRAASRKNCSHAQFQTVAGLAC